MIEDTGHAPFCAGHAAGQEWCASAPEQIAGAAAWAVQTAAGPRAVLDQAPDRLLGADALAAVVRQLNDLHRLVTT